MSEWREVRLGERCDYITVGHVGKMSDQYRDAGVPFLRSQDVSPFHLNMDGALRVSREFHQQLKKSALRPRDVVIVRTGYPGTAAVVPDGTTELNCADLVVIRPGPELDPWFVASYFNSTHGRSMVGGRLVGSAQQHFNVRVAADVRLRLPSLPEQRRITSVVQGLTELIEINQRRIELLEDLARSLYLEWFVRFRFPGHEHVDLVDSELGPIPSGWAAKRVDAIANLARPSVTPSREPVRWYRHFSIPNYDDGRLPRLEVGSTIRSGKYRIERECVLLSKLNPRIPRVWLAAPSGANESIASTEFLPWIGDSVANSWLWCVFTSEPFQRAVEGLAGGTSTSHQRAKPEDVAALRVVVPDRQVMKDFDAAVCAILREAETRRIQSVAAASTRDMILPRLVTGRLDISDIDLSALMPAEVA